MSYVWRQARHAGFTTVELMVALVIIAILASLAVPTFRSVIANSRIRAASQSLQDGLALARAEAVRLNTQVEFALVASGWEVRQVATSAVLHQASGKEGPTGLVLTTEPAGADRMTFNSFGQGASVNPSDDSARLTGVDIEAASPPSSGNYRPLRVELSSSGMARLCDPAVDSTEPRACLL